MNTLGSHDLVLLPDVSNINNAGKEPSALLSGVKAGRGLGASGVWSFVSTYVATDEISILHAE
jgi:hypothetical protein